jgi:signal transduction histidine kinase
MKQSLHTRLATGIAVSFVLLAGLQWLLAGLAIERLLKAQLAQRLERDAEDLLAALHLSPDGRPELDAARLGGAFQRPFSGHYYRIIIGDGATPHDIVSRSLWDHVLALPAASSAAPRIQQFAANGPQSQALWVWSARYVKQDRTVHVAVAEDLAPLQAGLQRWHLLYGALSAAVVVLVLLVQYIVVRRSLAPLDVLQRQLRELQSGTRERLDVTLPDEIAPLVTQLNSMLSILLRRSQRSRNALGNLAHSLKTRLAVLVQASEAPALDAHPSLRRTLADSADLIHRAIDRELRRARLMGGAHPAQRTGVRAAAQALSATLLILHAGRSPRIDLDIDAGTTLAMDQEDLMELLGNLMDNACTWCASAVRVRLTQGADLLLEVEDDGPGCPQAQIDAISQRGFRTDESRPGHGLGLAIVRDLVDSYGGTLDFGHSTALGGLHVTVHLPATLGLHAPIRKGD